MRRPASAHPISTVEYMPGATNSHLIEAPHTPNAVCFVQSPSKTGSTQLHATVSIVFHWHVLYIHGLCAKRDAVAPHAESLYPCALTMVLWQTPPAALYLL